MRIKMYEIVPQQHSSTNSNSTVRWSLLDQPSNLLGVFPRVTLNPNYKKYIKIFITSIAK